MSMFVVSRASLRISSFSCSPRRIGDGVRFYRSEKTPTRTGTAFDKCSILEIKNSADVPGFVKKDIKDIKRETASRIERVAGTAFDFERFSEIKNLGGNPRFSPKRNQTNQTIQTPPALRQPHTFRVGLRSQKAEPPAYREETDNADSRRRRDHRRPESQPLSVPCCVPRLADFVPGRRRQPVHRLCRPRIE